MTGQTSFGRKFRISRRSQRLQPRRRSEIAGVTAVTIARHRTDNFIVVCLTTVGFPRVFPPPADSILFYVFFFHNSARFVERCTHCPDERLKTFRYAYICRPSPSFSPMRGAVENKNTTVKRLGENIIGRVRRTPVPRLSRVSMLPPSVKTSRLRRGRSFVAHTPAVRFTLLRVSARPFTGRTTIATGKVG